VHDRKELNDEFVGYDTYYEYSEKGEKLCDFYPIPSGKVIVLVFLGDKLIPFTTVRRWTPKDENEYRYNVGKLFGIIIKG
jgi:hypothetical protein